MKNLTEYLITESKKHRLYIILYDLNGRDYHVETFINHIEDEGIDVESYDWSDSKRDAYVYINGMFDNKSVLSMYDKYGMGLAVDGIVFTNKNRLKEYLSGKKVTSRKEQPRHKNTMNKKPMYDEEIPEIPF